MLGADRVKTLDFNLLTTVAVEVSSSKDSQKILGSFKYFKSEIEKLKSVHYDEIYNISHTIVSAYISTLLDGDVKGGLCLDSERYRRIEGPWARYFFAGNLNRGINPFHLADVQIGIADGFSNGLSGYQITIKDNLDEVLDKYLEQNGISIDSSKKWIALQCGASDESKRWEASKFGSVGKEIKEKLDAEIILLGTGEEVENNEIASFVLNNDVINLTGKTSIRELTAIISKCDMLISNDTGTMHLAGALGVRSIVLTLGNALSDETGPYSEGSYIVEPSIECFPCSFRVNCPHFNCHNDINPGFISDLAISVLKEKNVEKLNIPENVLLWKTGFNEENIWEKRLVNRQRYSEDKLVKEIYRILIMNDLENREIDDITLNRSINKLRSGINRIEDDLSINRIVEVSNNLLLLIQQGIDLSRKLEENYKANDTNVLIKISEKIAEVYESIYSEYIGYEFLRPLILLLRFDHENIPIDGIEDQIRATYSSFVRVYNLTKNLIEASEKIYRGLNKAESSANAIVQESEDIFHKLQRPRFKSERLTVILPLSDYYVQHEVYRSLRRLGHKVIPLYFEGRDDTVQRLLEASLESDFLITINHLGFDKNGELAALLNKIKLPYVSWFVDRPGFILLDHELMPSEESNVFTWEKQSLEEIKAYGFENVEYLPLATDDTVFKDEKNSGYYGPLRWVANSNVKPAFDWQTKTGINPLTDNLFQRAVSLQCATRLDSQEVLKTAAITENVDISVWEEKHKLNYTSAIALTATKDTRLDIAKICSSAGLNIYGDKYWAQASTGAKIHDGVSYGKELKEIYNSSIQINQTSYQMPGAVNQRVFDIPAAGGLLISDDQDDMSDLFDIKKECFCYSDINELPDKIKYLKNNEEEALRRMNRAKKRIQKEHTYIQRMQYLINRLKNRYAKISVAL